MGILSKLMDKMVSFGNQIGVWAFSRVWAFDRIFRVSKIFPFLLYLKCDLCVYRCNKEEFPEAGESTNRSGAGLSHGD